MLWGGGVDFVANSLGWLDHTQFSTSDWRADIRVRIHLIPSDCWQNKNNFSPGPGRPPHVCWALGNIDQGIVNL